jgi:hypothetical protein
MATITIRLPQHLKARVVAAIPWSEMRAYLEDRVAGKKARRPVAKKHAH